MANSGSYTVQRGDTLSRIARAHGFSWQRLARLNKLANPNDIKIGQVLELPEPAETIYVVKPGDTLGRIAARLGVGIAALAEENGLRDVNRIRIGQALRIPENVAPPPPPPSPVRIAPVAPTPGHELGALSAKYETSGRGPGTVSTGHGDAGGVSYGSYQLASKLGRPEEFLAREGAPWAAEFAGASSGTPAFTETWKAIALREPAAFQAAQHAFIKRTHYDVQIAHVRAETGIDLDQRSDAVRDAAWSMAVQHGPANNLFIRAMNGSVLDDRALLIALYGERGRRKADGNLVYFSKNSAAVQAGVAQRFRDELKDALAMLDAAVAPPPSATTDAEDWPRLVAKFGDDEAKSEFAAGKRVVIALRKPTNTRSNQGHGLYDDRMIVVRRKEGALQITEFPGNTEPSRQYGWDGAKAAKGSHTDRNRDGKMDLGRLRAGNYHYVRQAPNFLGAPFFKARNVQASERDTNQDGLFTAADGGRIDPSGAGRSMYVHRGGNDNTWSAGCQTIPKSRYDAFLVALGGQAAFSYILIDLED